jgi:hypothetical protein
VDALSVTVLGSRQAQSVLGKEVVDEMGALQSLPIE